MTIFSRNKTNKLLDREFNRRRYRERKRKRRRARLSGQLAMVTGDKFGVLAANAIYPPDKMEVAASLVNYLKRRY